MTAEMKGEAIAITFTVGLVIGLAIGFCVGIWLGHYEKRHEAIRHGAAHYDAKTGEFKWNNPPEVNP